ncbi:MAG: transketolase C-terminal domain-containing protein, partial [Candidatus Izemoplasmatales bacterium]
NIEIVQPSTALEAQSLLNYAFNVAKDSVAIRYSRNSVLKYDGEALEEIIYPSWTLKNNHGKANLIAYGDNFQRLVDYIESNNLPINLINARFIKPMDLDLLDLLIEDELPLYVLEDVTKISGLGSSILEYINHLHKIKNVTIFGLPDEFILQGNQEEIYKQYHLDSESIVKEILK